MAGPTSTPVPTHSSGVLLRDVYMIAFLVQGWVGLNFSPLRSKSLVDPSVKVTEPLRAQRAQQR